jgi:hypothetical protein
VTLRAGRPKRECRGTGYAGSRLMRRLALTGALLCVLSAAGCASGITGEATDIGSQEATLHGQVLTTSGGEVSYWFEWVVSRCCQGRTPTRTVELQKDELRAVEENFVGITNAPHYYRLCAEDAQNAGKPVCGDVRTFTTTP